MTTDSTNDTGANKTPSATPSEKALPSFRVISPLRHDGEDYAIGSKVQMSARSAKSLLGSVLEAI